MRVLNDIDSYIRVNKKSYWTLICDDNFAQFYKLFKDAYSVDMDFKIICSTSVFPQRIQLSNKEFLLWDMKYWDFFDKYITYMAVFEQSKNEKEIISCQNSMIEIFLEYLVCKFDTQPSISYCIARDILRGLPRYYSVPSDSICKRFTNNDFSGIRTMARLYIMLHEIMHSRYRNNRTAFDEDITTIKQIVSYLLYDNIRFVKNQLDEQLEVLYSNSLQSILDGKNNILLEELACNYRAFIDLYALYNVYNVKENKKELGGEDEYLSDVQEVVWLNLKFQSELTFTYNYWNEHFKSLRTMINKESNAEVILDNMYSRLNELRIEFLINNFAIMQIIILHSVKKYNRFSYIDILSSDAMSEKLEHVLGFCRDEQVIGNIFASSYSLLEKTSFNPLQMIEARNMLMTWI